VNRGVDLQAIPDDPGIGQETASILAAEPRYTRYIEAIIGPLEALLLLENGEPGKSGLIYLQNEALEESIVVVDGKTVLAVVIGTMEGMPFSDTAVAAEREGRIVHPENVTPICRDGDEPPTYWRRNL